MAEWGHQRRWLTGQTREDAADTFILEVSQSPFVLPPGGNMYSDRVHYIITYHRSMLHLKRSKVALNVSPPLKILKDSAFTDSAISLRASLIVSQHIRLNLTNTVHLHYTCMSDTIWLLELTVKKDLLLQNSIKLLKTCRNILFSQTLELNVNKATTSPKRPIDLYFWILLSKCEPQHSWATPPSSTWMLSEKICFCGSLLNIRCYTS